MKKTIIIVIQLIFLWLLNEFGYFLVDTFNLPIPGNVIGMVMLFLLLLTGVVKSRSLFRSFYKVKSVGGLALPPIEFTQT